MAFTDQHTLFFSNLLFTSCADGKSTIGFYLFASCSEVLRKRQTYRSHVKSRLEFKVWRWFLTEMFTSPTFIVHHLREVQAVC